MKLFDLGSSHLPHSPPPIHLIPPPPILLIPPPSIHLIASDSFAKFFDEFADEFVKLLARDPSHEDKGNHDISRSLFALLFLTSTPTACRLLVLLIVFSLRLLLTLRAHHLLFSILFFRCWGIIHSQIDLSLSFLHLSFHLRFLLDRS